MTLSYQFARALQAKFQEAQDIQDEESGYHNADIGFEVEEGQKFDRIVDTQHGRHVHAFVERITGQVIKAAGWKAPQKDKNGLAYRYDLSSPEGFAQAVWNADKSGGYLYADFNAKEAPEAFIELVREGWSE